jgi:serine/threonine-protein kinase
MTSSRARGLLGSIIGDRWALDAVIGEGASSVVFEARDVKSKRRVAIKLLFDPSDARIQRERRAAALSHPNVCAAFEVHTSGELTWVVMERLAGETLADRIAKSGPLPAAEVVDVFAQLLSALAAVHDAGLVHGDVKPANVFLVARQGCPPFAKLLDFGASIASKDAAAFDGWHGSTSYMAPEQARRDPKTDARADIYSTGITLCEAMSGKRPSRTFRYLVTQRDESVPEIDPDVPPTLADVIRRATARAPDERYATAREMQAALFAKPRSADSPRESGLRRKISDPALSVQRPPRTKR